MVAEDRRLRLAGYEVYRWGGAELMPDDPRRRGGSKRSSTSCWTAPGLTRVPQAKGGEAAALAGPELPGGRRSADLRVGQPIDESPASTITGGERLVQPSPVK